MKHLKILTAVLVVIVLSAGCTLDDNQTLEEKIDLADEKSMSTEDDSEESHIFGDISQTAPSMSGEVEIKGLGSFVFDPTEVQTIRDDIFQPGHFSIFDVLVHLDDKGEIDMEYYYDDEMNTYLIETINNRNGWWYDAYYDGGWLERSVFRMDHFPYKDAMFLSFWQVESSSSILNMIYETYRDETRRKKNNEGKVIVSNVVISGENESYLFKNVEVTAHNLRIDIFKPGVITAIDTILSLGEAGLISYDLQWYESIGSAEVVKSYWVNRINDDENRGRCGFVYEAGSEEFPNSRGNHIHVPSDIRVINSPDYVYYFWICI